MRDARIGVVAITGVVLEFGTEPTVRHAADLSYVLVLIQYACYSFSKQNRERSLKNQKSSLG
ncbi:isochorismatase family protein [Nostoc sp. MG11]|uniref:isochorismatase family protein n=1 Tax=Nostoc sp. MG11 TaxID=2721166 RepID=UPI001D02B748|nr:isochorismatase family protein [Nostoc sp. MG11]